MKPPRHLKICTNPVVPLHDLLYAKGEVIPMQGSAKEPATQADQRFLCAARIDESGASTLSKNGDPKEAPAANETVEAAGCRILERHRRAFGTLAKGE